MTVMKEKSVDIISRMPEDKVCHALQPLEGIEGQLVKIRKRILWIYL